MRDAVTGLHLNRHLRRRPPQGGAAARDREQGVQPLRVPERQGQVHGALRRAPGRGRRQLPGKRTEVVTPSVACLGPLDPVAPKLQRWGGPAPDRPRVGSEGRPAAL